MLLNPCATLHSTSPPMRHCGPSVVPPRTFARIRWVPGPTTHGPSNFVNAETTAPAPTTTGPFVVSATTIGSTFAVGSMRSNSAGPMSDSPRGR